jgi:hypothetical protein
MKKSSPRDRHAKISQNPTRITETLLVGQEFNLTDYETFHFIFSKHVNSKNFFHAVVVFICTAACSHNAQPTGNGAIESLMVLFQFPYEIDTEVDPVGFEVHKIEPPPIVG